MVVAATACLLAAAPPLVLDHPVAAQSAPGADDGTHGSGTAPTASSSTPSSTAPPAPSSTTTSTTTTTTPVTPSSVTPPETTTTTIDPDDPTSGEGAPPEEVPVTDLTVPGADLTEGVRRDIGVVQTEAIASSAAVAAAIDRVDELSTALSARQVDLARLDVAHEQALTALATSEEDFRLRVADALVRGGSLELSAAFSATDIADLRTQGVYARSLADGDLAAMVRYQAERDAIDDGLLIAYDDVAQLRRNLRTARADLERLLEDNAAKRYRLAIVGAGSPIAIEGFVFPVAAPYDFVDSWGFPRMIGTEYAHGHQGTDIMAGFGTELYAAEDGVLIRLGTDALGGVKLWLKGASGTYYYYAHLQSYADGVAAGDTVGAGTVIGYVGDSGNARGGAPHLHFQVHPGGGSPVDPYGLLRAVADLDAGR